MPGLFFAFPGIAHKLQWVSLAYLNQVYRKVQRGDKRVEQQTLGDGGRAYRKCYVYLHLGQIQQQQEDQLGEHQPQDDGACHDAKIDDQAFPEHHDTDMLFFQPQYAVQPQLFLTPFDQEAVGVV